MSPAALTTPTVFLPKKEVSKEVRVIDGVEHIARAARGGLGRLEWVPTDHGDGEIRMWGEAEVRQPGCLGTCFVEGCDCGEVHFIARNKIVGQGLTHILNMVTLSGIGAIQNSNNASTGQFIQAPFSSNQQTLSTILVGSGAGPTNAAQTALGSPILTLPTTTSYAQTGVTSTSVRWSLTATWNSGTISGNVQELGVFGNLAISLGMSINGQTNASNDTLSNAVLFARLCAADAEFVAFNINTAFPLVVEYRFTVAF